MGVQVSSLAPEVKEFSSYLKKLETDIATVEKVNYILAEQLIQTRQCAKGELVEVMGFPMLAKDNALHPYRPSVAFHVGTGLK